MKISQVCCVFLFLNCLILSCREKCETQTWGVGATLSGIAYAGAIDNNTYESLFEDDLNMKEDDSIMLAFIPNYHIDWQKKQCESKQPEHSEYKFKSTKIKFRCIGKFNATHPDGSDVSEYFRIDDYNILPPDSFQYLNEYNIADNLPNFIYYLIKKPDPGMIKIQLKLFTNQEDDGISCISRELHFKN